MTKVQCVVVTMALIVILPTSFRQAGFRVDIARVSTDGEALTTVQRHYKAWTTKLSELDQFLSSQPFSISNKFD